jgi:hypothetical protein
MGLQSASSDGGPDDATGNASALIWLLEPGGRFAGGVTTMTIRAYVRVSIADQRCELQVRELRKMRTSGMAECGHLRGCEQWLEGQPPCTE